MPYGFSIVVAKDTCLSSHPIARINSDACENGKSYICVSPYCMVFLSASKNRRFVNTAEKGHWFVIGIGTDYDGNLASDSLLYQLSLDPDVALDEQASKIQPAHGQYVAVAYNRIQNSYIAVTDPGNLRSLFSLETDEIQYFSSSISMLRETSSLPQWTADTINQAFLLRYGYPLPGRSVYKDITEIRPQQIVYSKIMEGKSCKVIKSYSTTKYKPYDISIFSSTNTEEDLLNRMKESCRSQLGSNTKVGVLLGGFDSALVASLLVRLGAEVETYSFHYESETFNQPLVNELTLNLGIKHHWVSITPEVIRTGLSQYSSRCNWPTLWLNYVIQTQYLCEKMAADGMQSCFSGDGCDTAFLGYPSTHRRGRFYALMPRLTNPVVNSLTTLFHTLQFEKYLGHIGRVILSLISSTRHSKKDRALYSFQLFDIFLQRKLTNTVPNTNDEVARHFSSVSESTKNLSYEHKLYMAKSFISPNRCKLVSASDSSGLSIHSPYLHPYVTEFSRMLSVDELRPKGIKEASEGKYLLMKMAEHAGLLPKEVIYQPKLAAICSPIDSWLASELREFSLEKFASLPFDYDKQYVNRLLDDMWAEKLYKKWFAKDGVVSIGASLLLTYACLFQ